MDKHYNYVALEGCDRCSCGAKYWENDYCVSCGAKHPNAPMWVDLEPPEEFTVKQVDLRTGKTRLAFKCLCGKMLQFDPEDTEWCYSCMNPEMPREVGDYTDGYGNDYGWQDSTFPNER